MKNGWRMMRHQRKLRGTDNKGMTLVEIIVAMTIFAIVAVPTIHIFVSSSRHNFSSRRQQRATTLGESVMETFKAYSMADIVAQFDSSIGEVTFNGAPGSPTLSYTVEGIPPTENVWDVRPAFYEDDIAVKTPGVLNTHATEYNFDIANAIMEGEKYDIHVKVTPQQSHNVLQMDKVSQYKSAVVALKEIQTTILSTDTDINNLTKNESGEDVKDEALEVIRYQARQALKTQNPKGLDEALGETYSNLEFDDNTTYLHRDTTVDIRPEGGSDKVYVSVSYRTEDTVMCTYEYVKNGIVAHDTITLTGPFQADVLMEGDVKEALVYDNTNTAKGKLDSVYIFFTPAYSDVVGCKCWDHIYVNSDVTQDLDVCVVKQRSVVLGADLDNCNTLKLADNDYSSRFQIRGATTGGLLHLRTNMFDPVLKGVNSPTTGNPVGYSGEYPQGVYSQAQGFNDIKKFGIDDNGAGGLGLDTTTIKNKVLLYNVEISVRYAGKSEDLAKYVGTVNG